MLSYRVYRQCRLKRSSNIDIFDSYVDASPPGVVAGAHD